MTVGKLKEYLNDIDDNVEIKGLLLHCENGYAIQSKMRWTDNEDIIAELEKIKAEILDKVSMYENDFLIEPHFVEEVINKRISELKEQ